METQNVKFSNIHLADGTKFNDIDLRIEDDFTRQSDILDNCNYAIEQFFNKNEEIFYTVEYMDRYWNEFTKINYSTHNQNW